MRLAIKHDMSVIEISELIGASRQTVYNWLAGNQVSNAYTKRVQHLITKLKSTP